MPIIVGNETYARTIYDPDDIDAVFRVDGKKVDPEDVAALIEKGGKLDLTQSIKEDAAPITVTFRPLRSIDKVEIEDTVNMMYGEAAGRMAPGSMRRLAVKRAVVKWDYKMPFTDNVLDNLDPAIFEQLYAWVSWGVEPVQQDTETGLPLDESPAEPNRAQRRAAAKPEKKTPTTTAAPE